MQRRTLTIMLDVTVPAKTDDAEVVKTVDEILTQGPMADESWGDWKITNATVRRRWWQLAWGK